MEQEETTIKNIERRMQGIFERLGLLTPPSQKPQTGGNKRGSQGEMMRKKRV